MYGKAEVGGSERIRSGGVRAKSSDQGSLVDNLAAGDVGYEGVARGEDVEFFFPQKVRGLFCEGNGNK